MRGTQSATTIVGRIHSIDPSVRGVEVDYSEAKAALDKATADAEKQLAEIKKAGADFQAGLGSSSTSTKGDLDSAVARANERDEQGYQDARKSLATWGSVGTMALAAFPPAALAWAACVTLALGAMEALKSIGLDKLRVGRSRDAYTHEWLDRAHADQERLRLAGIPFPQYNEGQHVSPKEYAVDYLEAQNIAPIDALRPFDRDFFDVMGAAFVKFRDTDPVVTYLYAKASLPVLGWINFAYATMPPNEKRITTYESMSTNPNTMVDLIAVTAMREVNASPAYYAAIRHDAETGWNLGIAMATPTSGPYHYGRGARAAAQSWRYAIEKAREHAYTGPSRIDYKMVLPPSSSSSSKVVPYALGAIGAGALYYAGAALPWVAVPLFLGWWFGRPKSSSHTGAMALPIADRSFGSSAHTPHSRPHDLSMRIARARMR